MMNVEHLQSVQTEKTLASALKAPVETALCCIEVETVLCCIEVETVFCCIEVETVLCCIEGISFPFLQL